MTSRLHDTIAGLRKEKRSGINLSIALPGTSTKTSQSNSRATLRVQSHTVDQMISRVLVYVMLRPIAVVPLIYLVCVNRGVIFKE